MIQSVLWNMLSAIGTYFKYAGDCLDAVLRGQFVEAGEKYFEYLRSFGNDPQIMNDHWVNYVVPAVVGCYLIVRFVMIFEESGGLDFPDGWAGCLCAILAILLVYEFCFVFWPIIIPVAMLCEFIPIYIRWDKRQKLKAQQRLEKEYEKWESEEADRLSKKALEEADRLWKETTAETERLRKKALEEAEAEREYRELEGLIFVDRILNAYLLIDSNIWMTQHYSKAFDKLLEYRRGKNIFIPKVQFDEIENKKDRGKMTAGGTSARFALSVLEKYQVEGFALFDIDIESDKYAYADPKFIGMMENYAGNKHRIFISDDRTLRMRMRAKCPDVEILTGRDFFYGIVGEEPQKPAPARTFNRPLFRYPRRG